MLKQRTIVWVIGVPVLVAAIWFGTPWFTIVMAVIAMVGSYEFYRMAVPSGVRPLTYLGVGWVCLLVISPHCPDAMARPFLMAAGIVVSLIWVLFRSPREQVVENWAWTVAGILYVGWMLSYWVDVRILDGGREWVLWGLSIVMASDTGAFLVGRTWGRHALAPKISPDKTWEGAAGGLASAVAIAVLLGWLLRLPLTYWELVLLGCVICVFAQLGDLVESLFKRSTGVKDSGKLLPGHGGALDRCDSIIFTGPVAYYCIVLVNSAGW